MHRLIILLLMVSFAAPVMAAETYFCQGTTLVNWQGHEYESYKPQNFKFIEDGKKVTFGSGGYFNDSVVDIKYWAAPGTFEAETGITRIVLWRHVDFYSASVTNDGVTVITARCDKF